MGKKSQILVFVLLVSGCQYQDKSENQIDNKDTFLNSKILISRGGMEINLRDTSLLKTSFTDEVYRFEVEKPNILICSKGYGKKFMREGINDITFNKLIKRDTVLLSGKDMSKIQLLIKSIYERKEYNSTNEPTDDWVVKLQVRDKESVYYLSESLDQLNIDYLHLIDKIVQKSSIQVRDYR